MSSLVTFLAFLFALAHVCSSGGEDYVREYMEYAMADYKLELHKTLQTTSRRVKREITTQDFTTDTGKLSQMSDIANITPWQSIPTSYPVELEPFTINNETYMAVVNFRDKNGGYRTQSTVYVINNRTRFQLLQNFSTSGGIDFEFADLGREQYAIFLDHVGQNWYGGTEKYTYMRSFQVNQFLPSEGTDKPFQYRTKVRALGAKKVKVFTKDKKHYFVTANSYHEMGSLYHVKSTMHLQTVYGYQLVQEFATQGAQDVEVEVIDGRRYIFFANNMDNAGNVDIYSIVYREEPSGKATRFPFKLYQRIRTHGARDFEYFTFGGNHYLAVANEYTQVISMDAATGRPKTMKKYAVDSVIYWWTGTMWVQWQTVPTNGAVKWSFFESSFGDPMLVVANTKAPPVIFTYDPLRGLFVTTKAQDISPIPGQPTIIADVRSVMPFTTESGELFLAVANFNANYSSGPNVFKVTFEKRYVKALEPTIPKVIEAHLEKMKVELANLQRSLTAFLEEVTNKVMTKTTDQNVTSSVHMHNVTVSGTLTTSNLFYRHNVTGGSAGLSHDIDELTKRLEEQEELIKALEARFADAVLMNESATITGRKVFNNSVHVDGNLTTQTLNVSGHFANTKLEQLHAETLTKSGDQILSGNYTFGDVTVVNIDMARLNGRNVSTFLTTNTTQVVSGAKTFNDTLTIGELALEANSTVNGLRIPQDVVTVDGNQLVTGKKVFGAVEMKRLEMDGLLNGVDIADFNRNKMTLSGDQVVSAVVFDAGLATSTDVSVGGRLDGVDLETIGLNVTDPSEMLAGGKTFKSIVVKGHVTVHRMNGFDLDDVVTLDTAQNITAKMKFESDLNITGGIITNSTVNNLDISEQLVTINGNQTIRGHKTISTDITTRKDVDARAKVDGVDLLAWNRSAVTRRTKHPVSGVKRFIGGVNVTDHLRTKVVNNITAARVKDHVISVHNGSTWPDRFNFESLAVGELHVDRRLDGFRVPEDFVPLHTAGHVSGAKTFTGGVLISGNMSVNGFLSGRNFTAFYDDVLKNNTDEVIDSNVRFDVGMQANSVNVTGTLNGISIPDDVFTTNTYQNITTSIYLKTDTTFEKSVYADVILVNTTVNDVDVSVMEEDAVRKDKNQTINGTVIFVGGVDCRQNLSVAGLINGVNLTELMESTVRVSRDQNIPGHKTFVEDVHVDAPLTSPGTINGVDVSRLNRNALKRSGSQTVTSNIKINGNVAVRNLDTNGSRIGGVGFKHFVGDAVRAGVHDTVYGNLTYAGGLGVNTLEAGLVDGVDVSEVLLTRFNQSVSADLRFAVLAVSDVNVTGSLDGVDLGRLSSKSMKLYGDQNVTAKYTLNDVTVGGNVTVAGTVNGLNLTDFDSAAVHLSGNETITGHKRFVNATFGKIKIAGLLNNANISLIFRDALRQTGPQKVCQRKTFLNTVSAGSVTSSNIRVAGHVNKVNVSNLFATAVKLDGDKALRGRYDFVDGLDVAGNLTADGKVNNASIPVDFVTTNGDQNVIGTKTFGEAVVDGHLNVTGFVDGVNLTDLNGKRVTLTGDQELGDLHFASVVIGGDMKLPNGSTVNGIDLSDGLVPLGKGSSIRGEKVFNSTYVRGSLDALTGVVNGVDLKGLAANTVRTSSVTRQKIAADQRFLQSINITGDMTVEGLVNGVKVSNAKNYSSDISETIKVELHKLTADAKSLCNATSALLPIAVTEHVLTGIEKVDVFESFPAGGNLGALHSTTSIGNDVYISVARAPGSMCGPAYVLKCNQTMECRIHQTIITNAPKMEFFEYEHFDAMVVSHWKSGLNGSFACIKTEPEIWVFDHPSGHFLPRQTLNHALFLSDLAPVVASSTILTPYLSKAYANNQNTPATTSQQGRVLPIDIKYFRRSDKNYLAVGGYDHTTDFVDILYIEGRDLASLKLEQRIKANGRHVSVGTLNGQQILVTSSTGVHGSIQLYKYNERVGKFVFFQRLDHSASTVKIRELSGKKYLLYASPSRGFGLCEWLGVSGYGACVQLESTDTTSMETVLTASGAYTITGTDKSLQIYKTLFKGNSKAYGKPIC